MNKMVAFVFAVFSLVGCQLSGTRQPQLASSIQGNDHVIAIPAGLTLIAGTGTATEIQTAIDQLTDFLKEKGVNIKPTESMSQSRTILVDKMPALGATSLLYVTLDIGMGQLKDRMIVECFSSSGKKLWSEESGSVMAWSATGAVNSMVSSMKKKIQAHIGKDDQ